MRFLYKKLEVTYEEFLSERLEAEKEYCPSKSMTVKSKAAVVESKASPSLQKLMEEISALTTTVVKSASMGTPKTKTPNPKTKVNPLKGNGNKGSNANGNSPRKGKGPAASAAGPFKPGQRPLQCYKCGGWGHTYKECPSQGGIDWRGLMGGASSREGEGPRDPQTKLSNHRVLKRGEGKYYNPDPLYQFIGRVNEAKVKIDGCEVTGLIDSGANISSILKFCR